MDFDPEGTFIPGSSVVLASDMPDQILDSLVLPGGESILTLTYRAPLRIANEEGNLWTYGCEGEADGLILRRVESK